MDSPSNLAGNSKCKNFGSLSIAPSFRQVCHVAQYQWVTHEEHDFKQKEKQNNSKHCTAAKFIQKSPFNFYTPSVHVMNLR